MRMYPNTVYSNNIKYYSNTLTLNLNINTNMTLLTVVTGNTWGPGNHMTRQETWLTLTKNQN